MSGRRTGHGRIDDSIGAALYYAVNRPTFPFGNIVGPVRNAHLASVGEYVLCDTENQICNVILPDIGSEGIGQVVTVSNITDGTDYDAIVYPGPGRTINGEDSWFISDGTLPVSFVLVAPNRWETPNAGPFPQAKTYVDTGDTSAWDYDSTLGTPTLTIDGSFHTLDISSIVGPRPATAHVKAQILAPGANRIFQIKKNGNSNGINSLVVRTQVASVVIEMDGWVQTDADGKIEYLITATATQAKLAIRGYLREAA